MEVGRSCIAVDDKFLFDAGLKISEDGSEYPLDFDVSKIEAVFLSHADLGHTGALPLFDCKGLHTEIYTNSLTKETTKLLLKDSLHIELLENHTPGYSKENIFNVLAQMQNCAYEEEYTTCGATFQLIDAGHIPGSASILLEYKGMRILYTGDINTLNSRLVKGSRLDVKDIDVMICESTYGDREHTDRIETEDAFLDAVEDTLDDGGSVIVAAFAVGRSQEILEILATRKLGVPIYLDGMAKKVANMYQRQKGYIRDVHALRKAISPVKYVKGWKDRKNALKNQAIVVTTSGMLDGGPVLDYLNQLHFDSRSAVLMTGYQAEETNGRLLLETGKGYIDGMRVKFKGHYEKFDFSAHAGKKELVSLIKKINPKNLVLQHGDRPSIDSLKKEFKMNVFTPELGDSIEIRGDEGEI